MERKHVLSVLRDYCNFCLRYNTCSYRIRLVNRDELGVRSPIIFVGSPQTKPMCLDYMFKGERTRELNGESKSVTRYYEINVRKSSHN